MGEKMPDGKILVVDDDPDIVEVVKIRLESDGFEVVTARDGIEALEKVFKERPSLVILDITMPRMDGYELCQRLKVKEETKAIPIIMLTARGETESKIAALNIGADDYITKPFEPGELVARAKALFRRTEMSGSLARREAWKDPVTGLPNITALTDNWKETIGEREEIGVICLDVAKHDQVEEIYGWRIFDRILKEVAEALGDFARKGLSEEEVLSINKGSGDDFLLLVGASRGRLSAKRMEELSQHLRSYLPQSLKGKLESWHTSELGFYWGYSLISKNPRVRMERLLARALKEAEQLAGSEGEIDKGRRVTELKEIIGRGQIHIVFQPIVNFRSRSVLGYEALSRGPLGSDLEKPDTLFALAKEAGLLFDLGRLCREKAILAAKGMDPGQILFLNINPQVISDLGCGGKRMFNQSRLNVADTVLEITERTAIKDFKRFRDALDQLKTLGLRIAVDDTGSGYSSLQSIAEFKPEFIKFDISIIKNIDKDKVKRSLVETLLKFSQGTASLAIAEGIEREEEYRVLTEMGVEYGQGYLFAHPGKPFPVPVFPSAGDEL